MSEIGHGLTAFGVLLVASVLFGLFIAACLGVWVALGSGSFLVFLFGLGVLAIAAGRVMNR